MSLNSFSQDWISVSFVTVLVVALGIPVWAGGQAVMLKHPVLKVEIDPVRARDYEASVQRLMAMTEEEFLSFVPRYGFANYCECPNCFGGVEGNHIFTWTIDRPEELKCRFCGTTYPNAKYPEDKVLTGKSRLGETVSFSYYFDEAHKSPHFLTANLWMYRRNWLTQQCQALGQAYLATGKGEYARRVALALDRFAEVYPHYPVMQNLPRRFAFRDSQEPPYPWDSGKWGYFHNEIPIQVLPAYDMAYNSEEFDKLSKERGYDVREKIERDFLKAAFAAASVTPYRVSNVVGYDIRSAAILGRVINEPGYVHWAFAVMKENLDAGFFFDGMWHESPSYHYMTIGGLKSAFDAVQGYSDPPGFVDPVDGTRFDNLDPLKQIPFWAKCQRAPEIVGWPNGRSSTLDDTHPYEKRASPREDTVSSILPGFGHASLGRGSGPNQMQAQLHFNGGYGHCHYDNLNLSLWAKEREMLSDLGYTWTQMRYWTTCTAGHNLVVVDRKDQTRPADGDLLSYFPNTAGVSMVEADGVRAYKNISGVNVYRRMLVMIPVSPEDAYVVDIFRVRGGSTHDWVLHGDADHDTTALCSLPLSGKRETMLEPGEVWKEPTIEGATFNPYGMIRDLQKANTDRGFEVQFRYEGQPERGMRVHLLPGGAAEIWLGKSPSVRRMGQGSNGDMRKAYDFWMPQLLLCRSGPAPLESVFAAVEAPYLDKPLVASVTSLKVTPEDKSVVALQVCHGDAVDTIIHTLDSSPYPERVTSDGFRMKGRLGVVRRVGGKVTAAWLLEGEHLTGSGLQLRLETSRYTGGIIAGTRTADGAPQDSFSTDANLPVGDTLRGVWMIVTHGNGTTHGYEINHVEKRAGKTVIILTGDHGLNIKGEETKEVFFPRRAFTGKNGFVIPLAATVTMKEGRQ